jgi:GNAT superfamily N-acetyltransferase
MVLPDGYSDVPAGKLAAVVTCLEMMHQAPARPEPSTIAWTLQRVAHPTLVAYRTLFAHVGSEWLWSSRLAMPDQRLQATLDDPQVWIYTLSINRQEEGLLELDFRERGECELAFFGLSPVARDCGAGRWLMNRALEFAWQQPIRRLWVHTCTLDHPKALAFYLRSGFVAYERRVEVFDDPRVLGHVSRGAVPEVPLITSTP